MAYSYHEVADVTPGDTLAVPFPYLQKTHVWVMVDGVIVNTSRWSWVNDGLILTHGNFPSGDVTKVYRKTPVTELLSEQTGGAAFDYDSVNQNSLQTFYVIQEVMDNLAGGGGAGNFLQTGLNLSDVPNKTAARANLGIVEGGGVTDHGGLTGLSDDDHTQYVKADGSRAITALQSYSTDLTPSDGKNLVPKKWVEDRITAAVIGAGGYTDEQARDAVQAMMNATYFTVNDGADTITLSASVIAGLAAAASALQPSAVGTSVQAYDADTLKRDITAVLTAGYTVTPYSAGTKSSGSWKPIPSDSNFQYVTNGGAHTLTAPDASGDYQIIIKYTNTSGAGTVAASGFTYTSNFPAQTTTNGHKALIFITKSGTDTFAHWQPLQ